MTMRKEELGEIVASHGKWLRDEGGKRADLAGADLCGASLYRADLRHANLRRADLYGASLYRADLCRADLRGADLRGADLRHANLRGTILRGTNLEGANLPVGMYQIVGPGSCNRCTTYDVINDQIVCGCWNDGKGNHLDSFARRIEEIYGTKGENPNSKYYAEYMSAISFFKTMKELNKE